VPGDDMILTLLACSNNPRVVDSLSDGMSAAGITELDLATESENLVVNGNDSNDVSISVELDTTRTDRSRDKDAMDAIHLELRGEDDGIARAAVWLDNKLSRYTTKVTIGLPSKLALAMSDDDGDLDISSVASIVLDDHDGDIHITDVSGSVVIDDGDGLVDVASVGGNVGVQDKDGDIEIEDVAGTVTVDDGSGDITIVNAAKVVISSDGSGAVVVK
jgi:hypothetical protein